MSKTVYMICNAHIDPVWQWEWEEGAAEALSTFRTAADLCERFDGFVFNHNEVLLYRWVEEYDPALFQRIQRLVREGKWHIMGGWFLQPDCNMPSGEGIVRQILEGRKYFQEKFGVAPTTAINFDPFGHSRGLVQILKKSGYDSYLFTRPSEKFIHLEKDLFRWVGYDGSEVMGQRIGSYNSVYGEAVKKITWDADNCEEDGIRACLWGVGNHGGGPSRKDLEEIQALLPEMEKQDVHLLHSTPETYFAKAREQWDQLPRHEGDLNPWAPGCYTSQIQVKQKYRQLESCFFLTEKMSAAASLAGMAYPHEELQGALYDLLTAQFHDFLPGTSVRSAEDMAIRTMDHGLEILSRVKARAFFALSSGQERREGDVTPVLIYNPYPYPITGDFACEMSLAKQNWDESICMTPQISCGGKELPTQLEKAEANIPLDWRKKVVFHATLEPMQMNRFDCRYQPAEKTPRIALPEDETHFLFDNGLMQVAINKKTGYIDRYIVGGVDYLACNSFRLRVVDDSADPWAMLVTAFPDQLGTFALLDEAEGAAFSGVKTVLPSVRVIENGAVRTVVEALLGYGRSRAVIQYTLSHHTADIEVQVRLQWVEPQKMVKMELPTRFQTPVCRGQVAYGEESLPTNGRENVSQRYTLLEEQGRMAALINNGVYGSSCEGNMLYTTLLRSPAYTAHPIQEREIVPQDRFVPHIDQGERCYSFLLCAGAVQEMEDLAVKADAFNEKPMAISFYPSGAGQKPDPAIEIDHPTVQLIAFKRAQDEEGYVVRLFNPHAKEQTVKLISRPLEIAEIQTLQPYEILSLRLQKGRVESIDLLEHPVFE